MTPEAIAQVWLASLAVFVLVLVVVALLLTMILRTATEIHRVVADIWTAGQKVANNTIHLALLNRTNYIGRAILESAGRVADATSVIATHAETCPGCPTCVTRSGGRR